MSSGVQQLNWLNFSGFEYLSVAYDQDVDIKVNTSEDVLVFYLPFQGNMEIRQRSGSVISGTGPIAIAGTECRSVRITSRRRHIRISLARKNLMARLGAASRVAGYGPLKFQQSPSSVHLSPALGSMVLASFTSAADNQEVAEERLSALGSMIESAILHFWPNNFTEALASRERIILPRQIKIAADMISADPFQPFAVSNIARECGVSTRTLQYGFRNFASCSIREFIQQERFRLLERALSDPDQLKSLKARIGVNLLRNTNRLHEKSVGRPIVPWVQLEMDA